MANRDEIISFLDEFYGITSVDDKSNNGLQVQGSDEITMIALAVDASMETFLKAKEAGAQLLIVHHGLSWGDSLKYICGINYERVRFLIENRMSLYACHLPMDMHGEIGHNIVLARLLKLDDMASFGTYGTMKIGLGGNLAEPVDVVKLATYLDAEIDSTSRVWQFGRAQAEKVAVVSGSGGSFIEEAYQEGYDTMVTGEAGHSTYILAKELRMNVIVAGHYATETVGLKRLGGLMADTFNIDSWFLDAPTGL